jgi:hypothetical protein
MSKNTTPEPLPSAEDIKRWFQLLVGRDEAAMIRDMQATHPTQVRLRSLTEAAQGAADALDAYKAYSESSTMNIEHEESILLTGDRALSTLSKEGITPGGG